jgi:predicted nucleic acid-binding protein
MTERSLAEKVDPGEASAIALALEKVDASLILDDLKARKLAKRLGLDVTGSVGVILRAKSLGLIPAIRPLILLIRTTSFRLSPDIERQAFLLAGENDQ